MSQLYGMNEIDRIKKMTPEERMVLIQTLKENEKEAEKYKTKISIKDFYIDNGLPYSPEWEENFIYSDDKPYRDGDAYLVAILRGCVVATTGSEQFLDSLKRKLFCWVDASDLTTVECGFIVDLRTNKIIWKQYGRHSVRELLKSAQKESKQARDLVKYYDGLLKQSK